MQFNPLYRITRSLPVRLTALTAALLLSSCATTIKDERFYTLIPEVNDPPKSVYEGGAAADNFLSSSPQLLTKLEWRDVQKQLNSGGLAVVCFSSQAEADFKSEIEKLCTKTKCNQELLQAKAKLLYALTRIEFQMQTQLRGE